MVFILDLEENRVAINTSTQHEQNVALETAIRSGRDIERSVEVALASEDTNQRRRAQSRKRKENADSLFFWREKRASAWPRHSEARRVFFQSDRWRVPDTLVSSFFFAVSKSRCSATPPQLLLSSHLIERSSHATSHYL
jgi:hypothetical protein